VIEAGDAENTAGKIMAIFWPDGESSHEATPVPGVR
jgi:hypothetical protein